MENTNADRILVDSIVTNRVQEQNWKTRKHLLDHRLRRYRELTYLKSHFYTATVTMTLDSQPEHEPQPKD